MGPRAFGSNGSVLGGGAAAGGSRPTGRVNWATAGMMTFPSSTPLPANSQHTLASFSTLDPQARQRALQTLQSKAKAGDTQAGQRLNYLIPQQNVAQPATPDYQDRSIGGRIYQFGHMMNQPIPAVKNLEQGLVEGAVNLATASEGNVAGDTATRDAQGKVTQVKGGSGDVSLANQTVQGAEAGLYTVGGPEGAGVKYALGRLGTRAVMGGLAGQTNALLPQNRVGLTAHQIASNVLTQGAEGALFNAGLGAAHEGGKVANTALTPVSDATKTNLLRLGASAKPPVEEPVRPSSTFTPTVVSPEDRPPMPSDFAPGAKPAPETKPAPAPAPAKPEVPVNTKDPLVGKTVTINDGFHKGETGTVVHEQDGRYAVSLGEDTANHPMYGKDEFTVKGEQPVAAGAKEEQAFMAGEKATGYSKAEASGKTFPGPEGKTRFEVTDQGAKFKDGALLKTKSGSLDTTLGELIDHPKLFKQYPDLAKMRVIAERSSPGNQGAYNPELDAIKLNVNRFSSGPAEDLKTIIHEVQHAIQTREGFEQGGNPVYAQRLKVQQMHDQLRSLIGEYKQRYGDNKLLSRTMDAADQSTARVRFSQAIEDIHTKANAELRKGPSQFHDDYRRIAGEAEAWAVENRSGMSQAELDKTNPYSPEYTGAKHGQEDFLKPSELRPEYKSGSVVPKSRVASDNSISFVTSMLKQMTDNAISPESYAEAAPSSPLDRLPQGTKDFFTEDIAGRATVVGRNAANLAHYLRAVVAPERVNALSERTGLLLRNFQTRIANAASTEMARGKEAFKFFNRQLDAANITNISTYERTGKFHTEPYAGYSQFYKASTDWAANLLNKTYETNNFGRIQWYVARNWILRPEDQNRAAQALYHYVRSLTPDTRNFKERVLNMPLEEAQQVLQEKGIDAKLETTNPEVLRQKTMVNAVHAAGWKELGDTLKASGLVKFVRLGEDRPSELVPLRDRAWQVLYPSKVKITESFDKKIMDGLNSLIDSLGGTHERGRGLKGSRGEMGANTHGVFIPATDTIRTRIGGSEGVVMHEAGHLIDERFGVGDAILRQPGVTGELGNLAKERGQGLNAYTGSHDELIANLLHAYLHAPELLQRVAPTALQAFEAQIDQHPELAPLRDIKPSLQLGTNETEVNAGLAIGGQYMARPEVARLLNNATSTGLETSPLYRTLRDIKNSFNMIELGFSGFHALTTTINAASNDFVLGVRQLGTGLAKGDTSLIGKGAVRAGRFLVPGSSIIRQTYLGSKAFKEFTALNPESSKILRQAITPSGHRLRMDNVYQAHMISNMVRAWHQGNVLGAAARAIPAAFEASMKPILEHLVPNAKLGAMIDRVDAIRQLNPGLTDGQLAAKFAQAADSIDNIYGQLAYDNLFWNKTLKDVLMISTRSVGWNLGTIREIGGGLLDLGTQTARGKGITDRTIFAFSLPMIVGLYSAMYQFYRTGKGPQELKDFFYPRTGLTNKNGDPDRVALPSYMKDVFSYGTNPIQTVENKMAPELSTLLDIWNNKNFYGDMIRNPDDSTAKQFEQVGSFVLGQLEPFSAQQFSRELAAGGGPRSVIESLGGIVGAPASATKTSFENQVEHAYARQLNQGPLTPEQQQQLSDKANARQALKQGNPTLFNQLVKNGVIKDQKKFETAAQQSLVQRTFNSLNSVNKDAMLKKASPQDLQQLDLNAIEMQAGSELNSSTATPANKAAARDILSILHGDSGQFQAAAKAARNAKAKATRAAKK